VFDVGASLTAARESQGLALADAERLTRLREKHLRALEENRFEALPGRAYARAFLRSYADALCLDADRFVEELDHRFPEPAADGPAAPVFRARARRGFPVKAALVLGALAAFAAVIAWSGNSYDNALRPVAPPQAKAAPTHRLHGLALAQPVVHHYPLVIHAARGACWVLVRRGGAAGPVLYEGVLTQGQSVRFAPKVWVRLGAPGNVAVRRGPHVVGGLPAATPVNLVA
jgi:hypothetical protein